MSEVSSDIIAKVMALDPEKRKNVPLRLAVAARLSFPDGTMGASGLRKERDRGNLVTEMIAGKEYTTLAAIERMRELCRRGQPATLPGTRDNDIALARAEDAVRRILEKPRQAK